MLPLYFQRRHKYQDTRLKALQARNDFLLALEAANAAVHRYFADDLSDIMDCMDVGFHTGVARALLMTIAAQECVMAGQKAGVDGLHKTISGLDSRLDKQKFIEANNNPFMLPKKFEFTPHRGDQVGSCLGVCFRCVCLCVWEPVGRTENGRYNRECGCVLTVRYGYG